MAASTFHEIRFLYKRTTLQPVEDIVAFHGLNATKGSLGRFLGYSPLHAHLCLHINGYLFTAKSCLLKNTGQVGNQPPLVAIQYEFWYNTHVVEMIMVVEESCLDRGIRTHTRCATDRLMTFRDYFALAILIQEHARQPHSLPERYDRALYLATDDCMATLWIDNIYELFEKSLLFRGPENDRWSEGRPIFRQKLLYYVQSRSKIYFCLPAFPCKSCNPDKVAGLWPDGAEFEALSNIYTFCNELKIIYPPGCVVEIVSDGHVFSDCIGVDDEVVTEYNTRLCEMASKVRATLMSSTADDKCVRFKSLNDLLQPLGWTKHFFQRCFADIDSVYHPVKTCRSVQDDLNRGLLLRACSMGQTYLQQTIRQESSSDTTMLYRGFSRFMLDDLASHADCMNSSKSQRKKLAERVALEMMHRNAAYSNLVELTLPRHVRLSIHAHNNSGPKFAISLLPQRTYRPLTSFDGLRLSTQYNQYDERHHLHIPTPWHNCLVEVEGDATTYVCKAGLVKTELESSGCAWSLRSGYDAHHARGGRYMLYRNAKGEQEGGGLELTRPQAVDVGSVSVKHS